MTPNTPQAGSGVTEKLAYVIAWLEGGCDPKHAAAELRSIAAQSRPPIAKPCDFKCPGCEGCCGNLPATPAAGAGGSVGAEPKGQIGWADFNRVVADRERGKQLVTDIAVMLESELEPKLILSWIGERTGRFLTVITPEPGTPAPEQATTGSGQAVTDAERVALLVEKACWHRDSMGGHWTIRLNNKRHTTFLQTVDAILSTASPAGEGEVEA